MPNLSDQLQSLIDPLRELEKDRDTWKDAYTSAISELDEARQDVSEREKEIERLIDQLESLSPSKPQLQPDNAPNVEITFGSHALKPHGTGDLWSLSGERRWYWDVDNEVRVILDAKSDGLNGQDQIRIILQYCWADEKTVKPLSMPIYTSHVKVEIDNQVVYDAPIRLHYGQRPPKTFRRHPLALQSVKDLGGEPGTNFPNYQIPNKQLTVQELNNMVKPVNWFWQGWEEVNASGTYDSWSETFGFVVNSWTGGGAPSANEASVLPPWDVALLLSGDSRLAEKCLRTADSSGNYQIHYYSKESGQSHTYLTADKLPFTLVETNLPSSATANGKSLPKPDLAHCLAIPDLAALVTGERYYVEELESWVLVGSLCRKIGERSSGVYFSGQVRAAAWWLRNLYHLSLASPEGAIRSLYESQLVTNLKYLNRTFADPASPQYKSDGVLSTMPIRSAPMTKYADPTAKEQTNTGNTYFLIHILSEIYQAGYVDALPILTHLSVIPREVWHHAPSRFLTPWFQHIYVAGGWPKIIAATFHSLPDLIRNATKWGDTPIYIDYIAWYRASIVGIIDCLPDQADSWAREALSWIDGQLAKEGRQLPIAWAIEPRKG